MSEMVDRVAMAIWSAEFVSEWGNPIDAEETELCRVQARAAIEAMRDPTDAMVTAGAGADDVEMGVIGLGPATEAWQLMIDAALQEGSQ